MDQRLSGSENLNRPLEDTVTTTKGGIKWKSKIVRDPVHGTIYLDDLAVKIIDTPYFQRLRNIKQLSFVDYVYPGATHTSFAHSIGVYHLARQIIEAIETKPPPKHVEMSPDDKTCICVAALCRGLGCGPFGHAYMRIAKYLVNVERKQHQNVTKGDAFISHRHISAVLTEKMFLDQKYELIKRLGTTEELRKANLALIKNLIMGNREAMTPEQKKKRYMFQIISDLGSGMHVGEWDYCNRDAKACGVSERFQYDRALSMARVVKKGNKEEFVLAYRDYDALFLYNLFNTRFTLYQKVFRHRVVVAVELMIRDVFRSVSEANKGNPTNDGDIVDFVPIRTVEDLRNETKLNQFLELDDNVLFKIRDSSYARYKNARDLIEQIQDRKFYKMLKDIPTEVLKDETQDEVDKKRNETRVRVARVVNKLGPDMQRKIELEEVVFNYGSGINDPIEKFYFYSKNDDKIGKKLSECDESKKPTVRSSVFEECHLRVYYKPDGEMETETLRIKFEKLWSDSEASVFPFPCIIF